VPSETLSTFPLVLYYIFAINNECCGSSGHSHHLQKAIDILALKTEGHKNVILFCLIVDVLYDPWICLWIEMSNFFLELGI